MPAVVGEVRATLIGKRARVARGDERNKPAFVLRAYKVIRAVKGGQADAVSEALRRALPADIRTGGQALVKHSFASHAEAEGCICAPSGSEAARSNISVPVAMIIIAADLCGALSGRNQKK